MFRVIILIAFVVFSNKAFAQQTEPLKAGSAEFVEAVKELPRNFSGRWYTQDRAHSGVFRVKNIDYAAGTAKIDYYTVRFGCTMENYDAIVVVLGVRKFHFKMKGQLFCYDGLAGVLEKKESGYQGSLDLPGGRYTKLDIEMR